MKIDIPTQIGEQSCECEFTELSFNWIENR